MRESRFSEVDNHSSYHIDWATVYYGIYVQLNLTTDTWFLFDDNGGEQAFDERPTAIEIDEYRTLVSGYTN